MVWLFQPDRRRRDRRGRRPSVVDRAVGYGGFDRDRSGSSTAGPGVNQFRQERAALVVEDVRSSTRTALDAEDVTDAAGGRQALDGRRGEPVQSPADHARPAEAPGAKADPALHRPSRVVPGGFGPAYQRCFLSEPKTGRAPGTQAGAVYRCLTCGRSRSTPTRGEPDGPCCWPIWLDARRQSRQEGRRPRLRPRGPRAPVQAAPRERPPGRSGSLVGWLRDTLAGRRPASSRSPTTWSTCPSPGGPAFRPGGSLTLMPAGRAPSPNYFQDLRRLRLDQALEEGRAAGCAGRPAPAARPTSSGPTCC